MWGKKKIKKTKEKRRPQDKEEETKNKIKKRLVEFNYFHTDDSCFDSLWLTIRFLF